MAKRKKKNVPAKKKSKKAVKAVAISLVALLLAGASLGAGVVAYRYFNPIDPPAQEQPGETPGGENPDGPETPGTGEEPGGETPDPETPGGGGEGTETPGGENPDGPENPGTGEEPGGETPDPDTPVDPEEPDVPDEPDVPAIEYDTEYALWNLPASAGYTVADGKLTLAGTNELVFTTKSAYNSVTLSFSIGNMQDLRGSFQVGWGAPSTGTSINSLPFVQFNYDRAVICLPDGTNYDTSWVVGENWKLTIDRENNSVILSVDEKVIYNVDTSWWAQESWGFPGYLVLRAESNCALTIDKMLIQA